jgi:lipopolysaccharide export system permease protein
MTVGRLSSDNEVLVMLSSGLSYRNLLIPALFVGIFISLMSFFVNDVLLPAGTVQFNRLYRQILVSTPALELEANSVKRFKNTVIVTGGVTGRAIDNVLILDRTADGERRIIMAREAELKDAGQEGLSLDLENAFVQSSRELVRDDYDYASAGFLRYWVPQEDLIQAVTSIGPKEKSSIDVWKDIKIQEEELNVRLDERYYRSLIQSMNLEDSLRRGPGLDSWNRRENYFNSYLQEIEGVLGARSDRTLQLYRIEFYKKFSIPFGALSFVFLAVPLGLLAKKSGQMVGFVFGLIIALIYWSLLLGGQTMGIRLGYSPFWSMWLPNILAASIGLVLCLVRLRK